MRAHENPFRSDRIERLAHRPVGWTWDQFEARLASLNFRAAIVGPHGVGKTTLLDDLEARLTSIGDRVVRFTLRDEIRSIPDDFLNQCTRDQKILLDGAEQLSAMAWRRFCRRTRAYSGLIITSHRHGFLPAIVECGTTPQLLDQLLNDLLTPELRAGLGDLPLRLWRNCRGNLHDVFRELYYWFSEKQVFCTLSA